MNAEFFHQLIERRDLALLQQTLPGSYFDKNGRVVIHSVGKDSRGYTTASGVTTRDPGTLMRWWLKQRK